MEQLQFWEIPTQDVKNVLINSKETFTDFQNQNRRPRFSVKSNFIDLGKAKKIKEINIFEDF